MDYDDNDFHSQNLHLSGEGSNKFPPILLPYSLPKFDFDDSLHGNLRFDNLVEGEDFLGIDSQVDNRWIEDFSRGSSEIQFSSAAPESCSIPWCNNVWSEAASTESVEMLLKSVGQEEIIPVQTDNKELNACDELCRIVEEMEPILEQDSKTTHKVEDITDSRSRVATDDIPGSVSLEGIDVAVEKPLVEDGSCTVKEDKSTIEVLDDPMAVTLEPGSPVTAEVNPSNDVKFSEVHEKDANTECAFSGKQDTDTVSDEWYNEYGKDKTADDNPGTPKTIEVDQHCEQFAASDQVLDTKFVQTGAAYAEDTVSLTSSKSVEAKLTNFEVENQSGLQVLDASVQIIEHNNALGSSEAPLSVVENAKTPGDRIDGSCNLHSDSSSVWISSTQFPTETSVEGCVPSSIQNVSMQICEKNLDSEGGAKNKSVTDSIVEEKASEKVASDSYLTSAACNRTNRGSKSLLLGDGDIENKMDSESQSNTHSKPVVVTESANLISNASGCVLQAFSGSESAEDAIGGPSEVGSSPLPAACTHSDKGDENLVKISTKPGLPDSMTYLHEKTRSDIASGTDRQMFSESADQTSVEMYSLCKESPGDPGATCQVLDDQSPNKGDGVGAAKENAEMASSKASAPNETCLDADKKGQQEIEASTLSGDASGRHELSRIECEKGGVDHEKRTGTSYSDVSQSDTGVKAPLVQCEATSGRGVSIFQPVSLDPDDNAKKKDRDSASVSSQSELHEDTGLKRQISFTIPSAGKENKSSEVVNELPSTSSMQKSETRGVQDPSLKTPTVSNMPVVRSGSKSNSERKTRREPKTSSQTAKRRRSTKEAAAAKAERISNVSSSPSGISQLGRSNDIQQHGLVESSNAKPFLFAVPASGLPDLNSSIPPTRIYQQPFTDLQQLQLRAQIFVYGSLIQGTAPDEACMISAFGDGNRSMWENTWCVSIERFQSQKSHLSTPETPLRLLPGSKASDQIVKQSATQSKVSLPPVVQATSIGTPTFINPVIPLSSPVWNVTTPSRDSLHSAGLSRGPGMDYQHVYSPFHNFPGQNHHWLSQSPFGGPWVGTPQTSTPDASARFPVQLPVAETVKETRTPHTSSTKPVPLASGAPKGPVGVSTGSHPPDSDKITSSQQSTDPQPRKRKKNLVAENSSLNVLHSLPQSEPYFEPATVATPVASTVPASLDSRLSTEKSTSTMCPTSIEVRKGNQVSEQRDVLSENSVSKLKDALVQAEGATALAATAVRDSQETWDKMNKQKASGLLPDVETKLASAAVTIAAAAAVAKAAAAAANVASNAALQAKLMADEAAFSGFQSNPNQRETTSVSDGMKLVNATPASILKEDNGSSSSILVAAREATRKRIEAASAASKRAENMDAIVKAAELAAEAVSLAGKIVTMGDPLPLANLFSPGSDTCLKGTQMTSNIVPRSNDIGGETVELDGTRQGPRTSAMHLRDDSSDKMESPATKHGVLVDGISASGEACVMDLEGQKHYTGTDGGVTVGSVAESEKGPTWSITLHNHQEKPVETSIEDNIKEGSHVEVLKDGNGFKPAWFSAVILRLNEGKAYVECTALTTAEGSEKLKEWVALEGDGDEAPKIRTSRAVSAMPFEGTRKRRRAAVGDHNWCVGDRVDAWIQDSWQEGIITGRSTKDQTALMVHFPVQGETSVIKAWHLRPSLIWKDGKWTEWTRETNKSCHGGDTPQEKRQRLKSPALEEAKGKDMLLRNVDSMETDRSEDPTLLSLSASEKIFNVGKSNRDATKPSIRMTRTGLQKEGSRVVFGVPKPGKKRKFMEVSKHYVAGGNAKVNEANDSVKLKRHALPQPQGSVSRGWRDASKTKPLEKKVTVSKQVLKLGKPPIASARTNAVKDKLLKTATSASDDDYAEDDNRRDNTTRSEEATDGNILISSLAQPSDAQFSKRITSSAKIEHASKGKLAPATGKLAKVEENKVLSSNSSKSAAEAVEPRRSNRRIQPTSRLLEGLQSSMMVTKAPSPSHDRINKNRWR